MTASIAARSARPSRRATTLSACAPVNSTASSFTACALATDNKLIQPERLSALLATTRQTRAAQDVGQRFVAVADQQRAVGAVDRTLDVAVERADEAHLAAPGRRRAASRTSDRAAESSRRTASSAVRLPVQRWSIERQPSPNTIPRDGSNGGRSSSNGYIAREAIGHRRPLAPNGRAPVTADGRAGRTDEQVPPGDFDVSVAVETGALRGHLVATEGTMQGRQLVPRRRRLGVVRVVEVVVEEQQRHQRPGLHHGGARALQARRSARRTTAAG